MSGSFCEAREGVGYSRRRFSGCRIVVWLSILGTAPAIADEPAPANTVNLVCPGTASKDHDTGTVGSLLGGQSRPEHISFGDTVSFRLTDEGGEAQLPRRIQSKYKESRNGWFPLVEFRRSANEITGRIRLHSMYKPRFRLDRITGQVTVAGDLGDFSGTCQPYDPATAERKF